MFLFFLTITIFLTISILCLILYFITRDINRKEVDKNQQYFLFQRNFFKSIANRKIIKFIDVFIKEAGYPMGISIETYIIMVLITLSITIFLAITDGLFRAFLIAFAALGPLNYYIYSAHKKRKVKLQAALCDIQDIFYFQSKIGTPIDVILANSSRIAKEPLKTPLAEAATCYKITRNLDKALDVLKGISGIMEIQAFALILKQKEQTGFSEQNHKAQAVMMKRNKRLKRRLDREAKRNKLIIAAILLFVCYIFMVVMPIVKEIFTGVTRIMN